MTFIAYSFNSEDKTQGCEDAKRISRNGLWEEREAFFFLAGSKAELSYKFRRGSEGQVSGSRSATQLHLC